MNTAIGSEDSFNYLDIDKYEDMDKEELKETAIEELKVDKKEFEEEIDKEALYSKDTKDAIANLEYLPEKFENTMRGKQLYRKASKEEYYKHVGKAVAGEDFIRHVSSLIKSFSNKAMLISGKDPQDFITQFEDVFYTISDSIVEQKNHINVTSCNFILKEVKDIFWNVGDILSQTGKNMGAYFQTLDESSENYKDKIRGLGDN